MCSSITSPPDQIQRGADATDTIVAAIGLALGGSVEVHTFGYVASLNLCNSCVKQVKGVKELVLRRKYRRLTLSRRTLLGAAKGWLSHFSTKERGPHIFSLPRKGVGP